jgi:hypothetical protein
MICVRVELEIPQTRFKERDEELEVETDPIAEF